MRYARLLLLAYLVVNDAAYAELAVTVGPAPEDVKFDDSACLGYNSDRHVFTVHDSEKEISRFYYCSAYNITSAEIVSDGKGNDFVLLKRGEGRGTCARTAYAELYSLDAEVKYFSIPISWYEENPNPASAACVVGEYYMSTSALAQGGVKVAFVYSGPKTYTHKNFTIVVGSDDF